MAGGAAGLVLLGTGPLAGCAPPLPPGLPDGLFALGVSSGEPIPDGVVLWTRLAPDPLNGGGMPAVDVPVRWQVADDDAFRSIVVEGTAVASPAWAHCVKVDVRGLRPGAWYHYRFLVGDEASPTARTRTAPAPTSTDGLRFLVASCQNWKDGFWSAWAHAPAEDADLVIHLGDYIYEGGQGGTGIVRDHNSPEVTTLDAYRNRWGLYKGDPAIQAAHAACPWVVTWDDHEVENNYAGLVPQVEAESPGFPARRAAAYQAWWEHQAVRIPRPTGPDLRIHRSLGWGSVARFHALDTRQYRSNQACGTEDLGEDCPGRTDPTTTMLGAQQEAWLGQGLAASTATWDVLANQVVMTAMPLAGTYFNYDQWDGYPVARERLFAQLRAAQSNAVVLTGDIHAAGVADLIGDDLSGTPVGTELVGTSISSRFDPELADAAEDLIAALDHVDYVNVRQRGYLRCDVTPSTLTAAFRMVDTVASPTSPIATASAWTIVAGTPGANPA
jgi:alkaline phosphatase D